MTITGSSSVREVLQHHPATRAVFERYGMAGCGGARGPEEPVALFARAHDVSPEQLVSDLRLAAEAARPQAAAPADEVESYRYYLRAAVLIGALAGAALGAVNLTWIAVWGFTGVMPNWDWWPALIQAHGNAQLYGWTGLFIIGIACHSLPRMLRKAPPSGRLAVGIFALVFGGLIISLFAQPLAARPPFGALFVAAMALQWTGVSLFAVYLLRTIGIPREPYLGFIAAGTLWFWLGASARLVLSVVTVRGGETIPPAALNSAYLHAMSWGFLTSFVVGYSLRLLPAFVGLPAAAPRPAWGALAALTAGAVAEITARLAGAPALSFLAAVTTALGVGLALAAVRIWTPVLSEEDREAAWLARFARTAYFWLAAAAVILVGLRLAEALGPVSQLHQHAFGGASRHALTVGFVSLMIVGVAWRILPIFSGAERADRLLMPLVFGLLLTGDTLRVVGQMAAGLWGGPWYGVMGISGWLETFAIVFFALDVLRLLAGTPEGATLGDAGEPVALSLEAPVGPLVAYRPWLVPVFARHGMGQVSNAVFQRTVGKRVTLAQGCRRFGVEPEAFLEDLRTADREHEGDALPRPAVAPASGSRGIAAPTA